jgi:hypothetical protein
MWNFRFRTPDKEEWTAIDKWNYFRYIRHGGHETNDIMYEDEMIEKYGENFNSDVF